MHVLRQRLVVCGVLLVGFTGSALGAGGPCLTCPGDLDGDGFVRGADVQGFVGAWFSGPDVPPGAECADFDASGVLDLSDRDEFVARLLGPENPSCDPGPAEVDLDVEWIHGAPNCATGNGDPPIQVHQVNDRTFILRQNKCVNFEGPFMYLLFGDDKVLMQDTGATASPVAFPIQATVQGIINQWLIDHGRVSIQLIVTHSHSHGDHIQGDSQFIGQPNTTVVGNSLSAVQQFFGISAWPTQIVTYELGGRTLSIIPIPGHHSNHIAVYDPYNDWLLTGDTLYPGFLFISNWSQYQASIQRLVTFAATHNITYCMGTHIEMTSTPGVAYPYGTTYQPDEHVLQLEREILFELNNAVQAMGANPVYQVHDDFIIFP